MDFLFHFALPQSRVKVKKKRTLTRYASPAPTRFFTAARPERRVQQVQHNRKDLDFIYKFVFQKGNCKHGQIDCEALYDLLFLFIP